MSTPPPEQPEVVCIRVVGDSSISSLIVAYLTKFLHLDVLYWSVHWHFDCGASMRFPYVSK